MSITIPEHVAEPRQEVYVDKAAATRAIAHKLLGVLRDTVSAEGVAYVSLTGGGAGITTLAQVKQLLDHGEPGPDWTAVHILWGDERLLPAGDPERNETQAREALLDHLVAHYGLPETNIHPMPSSEDAAHPEAGAQMYAQLLEERAGDDLLNGLALPPIAVMLLGVGPDAHINSLFPGHQALYVTGQTTTGENSAPSALGPPMRVTLTFDAVHTARRVWTGVTGADKAEAAAGALASGANVADFPAANARGQQETVWHLDESAAAQLTSS